MDSFNHFSFINDFMTESELTAFLESYGSKEIKCFYIPDIYRGTGDPTVELTTVKGCKLVKREYIFLFFVEVDCQPLSYVTAKQKILVFGTFETMSKDSNIREAETLSLTLLAPSISMVQGTSIQKSTTPLMKQKYGKHTVYWDGIRRIYLNEIDKDDKPLLARTHPSLTPHDLSYINSQTKFRNLDLCYLLTKIKKVYEEKKDQLADTTINISQSYSRISRLTRQIAELKANIENKEYCITEHRNKITQLDTQKKNISRTIDAIKSDYDSIKSRYFEEVNSISADPEFSEMDIQLRS